MILKIEYDNDDECLVGSVVGITDRLVFDGESIPEIRENFHNVLDNYLALCEKTGKRPEMPKSGKMLLRLPVALHASVSKQSETTGESINNIVIEAIQAILDRERRTAARAGGRTPRKAGKPVGMEK